MGAPLPKSNNKPSRGRNTSPSLAIYNHRPKARHSTKKRAKRTKPSKRNSREHQTSSTDEDKPENPIITVIKNEAKKQAQSIGVHLISEGADLVKKGIVSAKDWIVSLFSTKPKPIEAPAVPDEEQTTSETSELGNTDSSPGEDSDYQTN